MQTGRRSKSCYRATDVPSAGVAPLAPVPDPGSVRLAVGPAGVAPISRLSAPLTVSVLVCFAEEVSLGRPLFPPSSDSMARVVLSTASTPT